MKKSTILMISILIGLCDMSFAVRHALALDPPHNTNDTVGWPITCSQCHYSATSAPPAWSTLPTGTDTTFKNNLCTSCHSGNILSSSRFNDVKTHSADNTGSSYNGGAWTVECVVCHNPHTQPQVPAADPDVNILTGTVASLATAPAATQSSLTATTAVFTLNEYIDYLLIPNTAYPTRIYRITANTNDTITVTGAINLTYTGSGRTFAIRYGKMVQAALSYPSKGISASVKFFNKTGPGSFGTSTAGGGANTAICQVCHTRTASFNNSGTLEAGAHPAGVAGVQACTDCHAHSSGFKAGGCTGCHGSPPSDTATLVFSSRSGSAVTSDSPGAGAHVKHTQSAGYGCATCHTGGMLGGSSQGDDRINIGFYLNGTNLTGNYDGTIGRLVYPYASGTLSTTVTASGTLQCSNLYCHSTVQDANGGAAAPTYRTPTWTGTVVCGDCHNADGVQGNATLMSTGSHTKHLAAAVGAACTVCHSGAVHVNRSIEVTGVSYTLGGAPGNGFGSCSAATCHMSAYADTMVMTPTWGTASGCSACHSVAIAATGPNTGGHALHNDPTCVDCHNAGTTATSTPSTGHGDGDIDIANVGYPANYAKHTAGSGYATCSTAFCHANVYGVGTAVTPTWGTSGNGCSACHSVAIAAYGPNTGGHALHNDPTCTDCHNAGTTATTKPTTSHADGDIDITNVGYPQNRTKHAAGSGYATCSAASCHSNVYGVGTAVTPTWGTSGNGCSACHSIAIAAYGPNTGGHALHNDTTCTDCHNAGTTATTKPTTSHADGDIDITNVGYQPNVAKHAAGSGYASCSTAICHGSSSQIWGVSTSYNTCTKCHGTKTIGTINAANRYLVAPPVSVASTTGTLTGTGQVSNDAKVGAHQTHLRMLNGVSAYQSIDERCRNCHGTLPISGTHANGSSAPVFTSLATHSGTMSPTYAGTTCNNTYCHNPAGTGGSLNAANVGSNTTPTWTNAAYIADGTLKTQTNCGICHKVPGDTGFTSTADHSSIPISSDCSGCHGHNGEISGSAGQQHIDGIKYGGGKCIDCHTSVQTGTHGTPRDAVTTEFGLAWGHKKSGRGAVTDADCIVCHLEGNFTTQTQSVYHGDGNIDLRDPDGTGETPITNMTGGAFTFTKFATSYAAGSRTSTGHTSNNADNVLTQKFCLACHDVNGATNTTARTPGGTQYMPWGGISLGANYTAANNAIGTQGLIDVKTQFATTNSSVHPVLGPRNKDFPTAVRLADPYKPTGTRGTQGTKTDSVVLNCFDCHNQSTPLTNRTNAAHGAAGTVRGTIYTATPTLCTTCHLSYAGNYQHHNSGAAGSAWGATGSNHGTAVLPNCHYCHGSNTSAAAPARPRPAQDYHGSNALPGGGLWTNVTPNGRPFAFIRGWSGNAYHRPYRSTEFTTGSAQCGAGTCPGGGQVGDGSTRNYTPGGSY